MRATTVAGAVNEAVSVGTQRLRIRLAGKTVRGTVLAHGLRFDCRMALEHTKEPTPHGQLPSSASW
jgi:hypothetical protein